MMRLYLSRLMNAGLLLVMEYFYIVVFLTGHGHVPSVFPFPALSVCLCLCVWWAWRSLPHSPVSWIPDQPAHLASSLRLHSL